MTYMLDSVIIYYILKGRPTIVKKYLRDALEDGHKVAISTVVSMELFESAKKVGSKELESAIEQLLDYFDVLPYDVEAQKQYIYLLEYAKSRRLRVDTLDLQLVAHTITVDGILVTGEVSRYSKIEGIRVEDWTI